jgi:hypothetical protein
MACPGLARGLDLTFEDVAGRLLGALFCTVRAMASASSGLLAAMARLTRPCWASVGWGDLERLAQLFGGRGRSPATR